MKQIPLKPKDINKSIEKYNISLSKKDIVVKIVGEKYSLLLVNKEPMFFYYQENLIPTLKLLQEKELLKKITVDMGAIKFVINGADIMRPGITKIDENIQKDEFIVIVDENNSKPLAIGIALLGSQEMQEAKGGKVIKNIHFVGDEMWNYQ